MHSQDTLKEKEEEKKKYRRRRRNSHSRPTQPLPRLCSGLPCTINSRTFFFVFFLVQKHVAIGAEGGVFLWTERTTQPVKSFAVA